MARRIFEIAKDLDVTSKAILDKCRAEGIPNMNNHMSAVSAGLEATIREWFTGGAIEETGGGTATAVETSEKVDLSKAKAKRKPRARGAPGDTPETDAETPSARVSESKPAVAPAPRAPVSAPAPVAPAAPPPARLAPTDAPERPSAPDRGPPPPATLRPAAAAPAVHPSPHPVAPAGGHTVLHPPRHDGDAGAHSPTRGAPAPSRGPAPVMNVPSRPKVVAPAGPRLEVKGPIKLSGPKVVRVEAPEVMESPRPRGARPGAAGGPGWSSSPPRGGAGVRGGSGPTTSEEDARRSPSRNKRRHGAPGGPAPAPKRPGTPEKAPDGSFNWRQQDLAEREERLARAGGFLRQRRRDLKRADLPAGGRAATAAQTGGAVAIVAPFTIKDLSAATGVKASDIVKKLFLQGVMATVNSGIDPEKAQEIMIDYNIDLQIQAEQSAEEAVSAQFSERDAIDLRARSPVVTIMGHVDHGKTSLLDSIRSANVAAGEAGGITQATSAFRVPVQVAGETKHVVFLDTPGHEAFTAMRARGANMTDVVVLVVAADDGVMPQTVESINHAQAAKVPIVVALNKIDKPEATEGNIRKIYGQLAERGLNPTEWGGTTEVIKTSATKKDGVQDLLEALDYQAQLLELKSDFDGPASGSVIESKIEEGRGPTANILVQNGKLEIGDFIVAGRAYGKIRDILDDRGTRLKEAAPAMPVRISGLDELPDAGDKFYVVETIKQAQEAAEQRRHRDRERELAQPKATLDSILTQLKEGEVKEIRVVVKADVQGSVDVLKKAIEDVTTEEVKVRVLHSAVGGINESDVLLAAASRAIIVGFNVIASGKARQLAEQKDVEIRPYQVIYDIVDDMKKAAVGMLAPELKLEVLGHAEVRQVFRVSRVGSVAGCYVTDGVIERNALIRVTRGDIVIESDRVLEQLKRFKDDAKEVRNGQECGMKIAGYDDIKEGDILECYRKVEVRKTL